MINQKKNIVLGKNALKEAFAAHTTIQKIFISDSLAKNDAHEVYMLAKEHEVPLVRVPREKLDQMTRLPHQGIIAWIDPIAYFPVIDLVDHLFFKGIHPCLCMLDGITDVRNFGAIARSAEVMGIHGLIISQKNSAPINEESIRSSAGALLKLPISRVKSMSQTLVELKEMGFTVVCCDMKQGVPIRTADLAKPILFILGAEGEGISSRLSDLADETVFIPQKGTIESLNVSVASGIIFYEWMLQNNS